MRIKSVCLCLRFCYLIGWAYARALRQFSGFLSIQVQIVFNLYRRCSPSPFLCFNRDLRINERINARKMFLFNIFKRKTNLNEIMKRKEKYCLQDKEALIHHTHASHCHKERENKILWFMIPLFLHIIFVRCMFFFFFRNNTFRERIRN